ncbi:hypothetical protein [uncultured Amphritea sp.]|uniref:hypothetical protein n=1 Tax=uncultured Amphritea sp. TaxID=981605 RepID=UPI0026197AB3|nr:hypothetical protein [uncultured Amphritea sp.]
MSIKSKFHIAFKILRNPVVFFKKYDKVILLSHMRSRTSVLSHIIGGHEGISGYYEQHVDHKERFCNEKIKKNLLVDDELKSGSRYLYDKILHKRFDPLSLDSYRVIVMVRKPEESIKSIVSMGVKSDDKWSDIALACSYYSDRLDEILIMLELKPHIDFCFITSEEFVGDTEVCLDKISDFISLDKLSSSYSSGIKTGIAVVGDTSDNIKAGKVMLTKPHDDIVLDEYLLAQAEKCYEKFIHKVMALPNRM